MVRALFKQSDLGRSPSTVTVRRVTSHRTKILVEDINSRCKVPGVGKSHVCVMERRKLLWLE